MNDQRGNEPDSVDDADRRVKELELIEEDVSDEFLHRVHNKIDRRVVTGQFFEIGFKGIGSVFIQYVILVLEIILPGKNRRSRGEE